MSFAITNFSPELNTTLIGCAVVVIILMVIFVLIFDFFVPMSDSNGNLVPWQYPFKRDINNDASTKLDNFELGGYLVHWYGYLWWGAIQQFLFTHGGDGRYAGWNDY